MPIEKWSDSIIVVHVADDPQFTEDIESAEKNSGAGCSAVLDFAAVHFVNSSNIARLLRLRRHQLSHNARLIICNLNNQIWSALLITGLDKIFEFSENVPTALATLQMENPGKSAK
jgi:anti-anti-sigma factor